MAVSIEISYSQLSNPCFKNHSKNLSNLNMATVSLHMAMPHMEDMVDTPSQGITHLHSPMGILNLHSTQIRCMVANPHQCMATNPCTAASLLCMEASLRCMDRKGAMATRICSIVKGLTKTRMEKVETTRFICILFQYIYLILCSKVWSEEIDDIIGKHTDHDCLVLQK